MASGEPGSVTTTIRLPASMPAARKAATQMRCSESVSSVVRRLAGDDDDGVLQVGERRADLVRVGRVEHGEAVRSR